MGVKDVIVGLGARVTLKFAELVAVPSALRIWMRPSVALFGTMAVIVVSFTTVNSALWLSNPTRLTVGLLKWCH